MTPRTRGHLRIFELRNTVFLLLFLHKMNKARSVTRFSEVRIGSTNAWREPNSYLKKAFEEVLVRIDGTNAQVRNFCLILRTR
jgi:hypothetical protein